MLIGSIHVIGRVFGGQMKYVQEPVSPTDIAKMYGKVLFLTRNALFLFEKHLS